MKGLSHCPKFLGINYSEVPYQRSSLRLSLGVGPSLSVAYFLWQQPDWLGWTIKRPPPPSFSFYMRQILFLFFVKIIFLIEP